MQIKTLRKFNYTVGLSHGQIELQLSSHKHTAPMVVAVVTSPQPISVMTVVVSNCGGSLSIQTSVTLHNLKAGEATIGLLAFTNLPDNPEHLAVSVSIEPTERQPLIASLAPEQGQKA